MILPTKRLPEDRALLTTGAQILAVLDEPKSINRLWDDFRAGRSDSSGPISFDWFVLSLDLLATIGVVRLQGRKLVRANT